MLDDVKKQSNPTDVAQHVPTGCQNGSSMLPLTMLDVVGKLLRYMYDCSNHFCVMFCFILLLSLLLLF